MICPATPRADALRRTVFEICDHLESKGRKPTNQAVRRELGAGSMRDIQPLVKAWKERRVPASPRLVLTLDEFGALLETAPLSVLAHRRLDGRDLYSVRFQLADGVALATLIDFARAEFNGVPHASVTLAGIDRRHGAGALRFTDPELKEAQGEEALFRIAPVIASSILSRRMEICERIMAWLQERRAS